MTDVGAISFTRRHEIKPDNRLLYVSIQHPDAVIGTYRGNWRWHRLRVRAR